MKPAPSTAKRIWRAYEKFHFAVVNFLARRVVGPGFVVVGTLLAGDNLSGLLPGGTTLVEGVPSDDLVLRWVAVFFPALVAVLGLALFRAKPYLPKSDHDDKAG